MVIWGLMQKCTVMMCLLHQSLKIYKSGPPVKRVVCSWAISPLYRLASKGAGFFISCSSQNAIVSLA
ncbi:hypothetical protein, partial [Staphylococcus felis]|uniref:hypothetical protein n=1 Tax=Staphylococcus felis TaxID=46127 RepID=UPI000E389D4A